MKKFIPLFILNIYHSTLALIATVIYGFPSKRLKVIGVTGTNGKTTTCHMLAKVLESAGFKVGMATSIDFKIGKKVWANNTKQGMQGRTKLRHLLKRMVQAKCDYAIIETTSEGIKQYRHLFIKYWAVIITNVTRDHLEAHGGMKKYRQAKEKIFKDTSNTHIINLDMPFFKHFLKYKAKAIWGYEIKRNNLEISLGEGRVVRAENIVFHDLHSHFDIVIGPKKLRVKLTLPGEFNVYNALATTCLALSEGIALDKVKPAFKKIKSVAGRMEEVKIGKGFRVFVDYAHSEDALEQVYKTLIDLPHQRIIAVLGATGGGRDKAKRPVLGQIARQYTDMIIVTDEDPYDEDPEKIMDAVLGGVLGSHNTKDSAKAEVIKKNDYEWEITVAEKIKPVYKILDRKQAIQMALSKAEPKDIVIITGKGAEEIMVVKDNKKIPFSDKKVVLEYFGKN